MRLTTWICDKCKREIKDVVYTLNCFAEDATPDPLGRISAEAATQNTMQNMALSGRASRHLCKDCKDKITDGVFIM